MNLESACPNPSTSSQKCIQGHHQGNGTKVRQCLCFSPAATPQGRDGLCRPRLIQNQGSASPECVCVRGLPRAREKGVSPSPCALCPTVCCPCCPGSRMALGTDDSGYFSRCRTSAWVLRGCSEDAPPSCSGGSWGPSTPSSRRSPPPASLREAAAQVLARGLGPHVGRKGGGPP